MGSNEIQRSNFGFDRMDEITHRVQFKKKIILGLLPVAEEELGDKWNLNTMVTV